MKRYSAYKDSGVKWLGQIPEHWDLIPNKQIFRLKKNVVGNKSNQYRLLSLTLKGIINRNIEDGGKFPAEFDTYQEVNKGDFVFCLFDVEETPRCIGLSELNGMITGAYTVFENDKKFFNKFLYYFYLNLDTDKRLKPLYIGLRNTIPKEKFLSFKTFVPPFLEQIVIANYLDIKTTQIDSAIAQKEQMIALLKERKQIIIQNTVTKGLNPNAKMKDSGVEWLGQIPEHWGGKKIKLIARTKAGGTPATSNASYWDGDIPWLPSGKLQNNVIGRADKFITKKGLYNSATKLIRPNTTLIALTGATCANVGYLTFESAANQSVIAIEEDCSNSSKYIFYALISEREQILLKQTGGAQGGINETDVKNIIITIPPLKEQNAIVFHIESQSAIIDKAIILKKQQIEKLKELKATIIDNAVTGKIKVEYDK